jgi:hypothetical protein
MRECCVCQQHQAWDCVTMSTLPQNLKADPTGVLTRHTHCSQDAGNTPQDDGHNGAADVEHAQDDHA